MTCARHELARWSLPADPAATERLGHELGQGLRPGDVLAPVGELGTGKTTLVRGLGRGLGVDDPDAVQSPTYLLVVEHPGAVRLLHADAYLPDKLAAFLLDGGLEYLFTMDAVTAIEWANRVAASLPRRSLWLELAVAPDGGRNVILSCAEPRDFPWAAGLGQNPGQR